MSFISFLPHQFVAQRAIMNFELRFSFRTRIRLHAAAHAYGCVLPHTAACCHTHGCNATCSSVRRCVSSCPRPALFRRHMPPYKVNFSRKRGNRVRKDSQSILENKVNDFSTYTYF